VQTANKSRTIAQRRSRAALHGIDFLVIVAIVITFAAIVSSTLARAKAETYSAQSTTVADQPRQLSPELALIKARIRLATGNPWN
jgi:hypothetical protein